jgi:ABC-type lipoprotein release transport system permease subunit
LAAGFFVGKHVGMALENLSSDAATAQTPLDVKRVVLALVLAPLLSGVASWIPATIAAQQDPAEILREE